ncbi:protein DMP5-like [Oryza brachyantha]|uniref:protein DMP5-like n=1 Tax=Oryza brachyantha TaxID=4533 RepID=UPI001ADC59B6|nr:protein DMP5-like [Oryza brachyantha]
MATATAATAGGEAEVQIAVAHGAAPAAAAGAAGDVNRERSETSSPSRGGSTTTPQRPVIKGSSPQPPPPTAMDKTLSSVANLAKLLPTGTALAFQSLSPSFTNRGACLTSNRYLTAALLYLCVLSCIFFSFTDSFVGGDGKLYYGVATAKGFLVFNYDPSSGGGGGDDDDDQRRRREVFKDLRRLRIRWVDYVHAVFTAVVFLTVAFSSTAVQTCYFPDSGDNVKQLLTNLPLGAGFLSTTVFLVFPTTRKGIGYGDPSTN